MYIYSSAITSLYTKGTKTYTKTVADINNVFESLEDIKRYLKDTITEENCKERILKDLEGIEELSDVRKSIEMKNDEINTTIVYGIRKVKAEDVI